MKPDIIPYTAEEAQKLGGLLFKLGVPSIGPEQGIALLRVAQGIKETMNDPKWGSMTPEMKGVLYGLRQRILDVCAVSAHQQQNVIAALEKWMEKEGS